MTKKELILKTAAKLFAEKGFPGTAIDEIAAEAGVAKGTVFYHFKTKADLLGEILSLTFAAYKERLNIVRNSDKAAIEKIVDFTRCSDDLLEERLHEIKTLMRDAPQELSVNANSTVANDIRTCFETIISIYSEVFEQGMQDGSIRTQDPRESAILFDSLLCGHIKLRLLRPIEIGNISAPLADMVRHAFEVRP